jgi:hypothetical protein
VAVLRPEIQKAFLKWTRNLGQWFR